MVVFVKHNQIICYVKNGQVAIEMMLGIRWMEYGEWGGSWFIKWGRVKKGKSLGCDVICLIGSVGLAGFLTGPQGF